MKPVKFPEATIGMGELQPQFHTLPMFVQTIDPGTPNEHNQYLFKYEFSDFDLIQIAKLRGMYFSQFGRHFHPVLPQIESPFKHYTIEYEDTEMPGVFNIYIPLDDGSKRKLDGMTASDAIDWILSTYPEEKIENFRFEERQKSVIDENGNLKIDL